jgi:hypothetical protein
MHPVAMGTKSRETIYGASVRAAAERAAEGVPIDGEDKGHGCFFPRLPAGATTFVITQPCGYGFRLALRLAGTTVRKARTTVKEMLHAG